MTSPTPVAAPVDPVPHPGMHFREFVALIAMMMAVNALGIDAMLPALPAMGEALGIVHANQRQWIVTAYLLGFGVATLIYGPLADRYGRKPVLVSSLGFYVVASLAAAFAYDFQSIIAARVVQGVAVASTRVLAVSIVRDCYKGRTMARVMSLTFIVFLAVPILAPSIGQLILFAGPWPWIFYLLAGFGATVVTWAAIRLPETLHPEYRVPIAPRAILAAARMVVTNRYAIGYTLASTLIFGALFGFITSVQQIFADVFDAPTIFPLMFAAVAGTMAVGSLVNSRIVERLGTRRVSHSALIAFILLSGLHALIAGLGIETIWSFSILQALTMGAFALTGSNFGAMAMEPVGHIAGIASSIQGFCGTVGGALLGMAVGQSFDGSTVPVTTGFFLLGVAALIVVFVVERGRLFQPHAAAPASAQ